MTSSGRISLVMLPRALRARFGTSPSYSRLYLRIVDGRIPAEQENGRWVIEPADLDAIGATFGLIEVPEQRTASLVSGPRT